MSKWWVVGGVAALAFGCGDRGESGSLRDGELARVQLPATASMTWDKQARLTSADDISGGFFGGGIAFEGTTVVVGAWGKLLVGVRNDAGAVYVLERSGATWSQQQELRLADPSTHGFGWAVALSGQSLLASTFDYASELGKAVVYVRNGNSWSLQAELVPPAAYTTSEQFGVALALEGDTALVGAHAKDTWAGAAYVFDRTSTTWGAGTRLVPEDPADYDYLGYSLALSGDTALVGAYGKNVARGAAYVFVRDGAGWTQQAKLVASDGANLDQFGFSVAIDGDTALVGANFKASESGAAYVFVRSGTTWSEQQKLVASNSTTKHRFGHSVAVKGDAAMVGAKHDGALTGEAYFFTRSGTTWSQQQRVEAATVDPNYAFGFGHAVAIEGEYALVAADNSFASTGAVYAFRYALAHGSDCSAAPPCHSGYCTDGVCCEAACQDECSACAQSLTGKHDGQCQPIPADQDPELECDADPDYAASCGADGLCDGTGQCRAYVAAGTECGAIECSAGARLTRQCSGAGECVESAEPCAPYLCDASTPACRTSCTTEDECDDESYCAAGSCVRKQAPGASCTDATQCAGGFCVDAVCCDAACDGRCEACAEPGQRGSCQVVSGVPRSGRQSCEATPVECGGACDGSARDACSYADATTQCGRACVDGFATTSSCDGQGGCVEDTRVACAPYVCDDEACRTRCGSDSHCAAGFSCEALKCVESEPATPSGCETDADCDTGQRCEADSKTCRAADSPNEEEGGCGCRLAGTPRSPSHGASWHALAALALALRRRFTRLLRGPLQEE